ncbi:hypothetical protein PAXRUDRAFT_21285 [Paxillus rubicundulus Ve08.2h10]|uniref:Uncharacterized protein n=1 Tax=Paxillus rubicundulus Ve08.2h10 TaxID=930991 RepID=A0A0D0CQG9_9AGAM|nr:hypothetical protein PAXRUDRAFT_21285 [Paxillus rubicundulus Ve08.2h10]
MEAGGSKLEGKQASDGNQGGKGGEKGKKKKEKKEKKEKKIERVAKGSDGAIGYPLEAGPKFGTWPLPIKEGQGLGLQIQAEDTFCLPKCKIR